MVFFQTIRPWLPSIIILSNKRMRVCLYTIGWLLLLSSITMTMQAQSVRRQRLQADTTDTRRGPYTVVVTAGSGLSYYSTHLRVPATLEQTQVNRFGVPASLRVMWYPDHRLRIGLESGWITMYNYRGQIASEPAHVNVSVIPVLIVFSMPLAWLSGTERSLTRRLSVTVGTGYYLNQSRLMYAGQVIGQKNSLGWMAASSYTYPIGRRFRVAGELKWYDAVSAENAAFTAELQLVWRAFSW